MSLALLQVVSLPVVSLVSPQLVSLAPLAPLVSLVQPRLLLSHQVVSLVLLQVALAKHSVSLLSLLLLILLLLPLLLLSLLSFLSLQVVSRAHHSMSLLS